MDLFDTAPISPKIRTSSDSAIAGGFHLAKQPEEACTVIGIEHTITAKQKPTPDRSNLPSCRNHDRAGLWAMSSSGDSPLLWTNSSRASSSSVISAPDSEMPVPSQP